MGEVNAPQLYNYGPAWFGLLDFKVLLLEKPGGAPRAQFAETKGHRWYSQKYAGEQSAFSNQLRYTNRGSLLTSRWLL